jgi:hypothetical protein
MLSARLLPYTLSPPWLHHPVPLPQPRPWQARQVGLDTEASPLARYHGRVCLLQLSVWDEDNHHEDGDGDGGAAGGCGSRVAGGVTVWLVDALALHDHVGAALTAVMTNPRVVKVRIGAWRRTCALRWLLVSCPSES